MVKFVRKDRGGGGGKLVYLYIVKIEVFHQILTVFLIHVKIYKKNCLPCQYILKDAFYCFWGAVL